ncbi:hypothetical protein EX895_001473 [Sporisorium graminicola]|uniref:Uncharacterized protein n=1 Tax=Sporisorium graminicola TaxID=280036 RepID=A0A4U7L1N4_9BASI|nr:hypothetical protein EX895_001473 [Sporisorium graminicola]TKY89688.1 hypothetical protein EX895_001473 [Sporisorium graminicola]
MKIATFALLVAFSFLELFCAQGTAAPAVQPAFQSGRILERRTRDSNGRILQGSPVSNGLVLQGQPAASGRALLRVHTIPSWWTAWSRHQGSAFVTPFDGNRLVSERLLELRRHVTVMEAIRNAAFHDPMLTAEDKEKISGSFNNWSEIDINEHDPNGLSRVGLSFEQDVNKLEKLREVLGNFAPYFRP